MDGLEKHPVYAALYEPVLTLGLPRSVLGPELTMLALGVYGLGWSLWSLLYALTLLMILHPLLLRLVRDDVEIVEVVLRTLRLRGLYQAHPAYRSPCVEPCGSFREP